MPPRPFGRGVVTAAERELPRALCVDDDAAVLAGLARQLRSTADVTVTTDPVDALRVLGAAARNAPYAVVVSDMRMPVMDGADLLRRARDISPETVRVLLTGYSDLHAALTAVNEGQLFRFLCKPCPPEELRGAVTSAVEQHRLHRAERELLEHTLRGSVDALVETLSLAQPRAFERTSRLRQVAGAVGATLGIEPLWELEIAAALGEIGVVTLPPEALESLLTGRWAGVAAAHMIARLPQVAEDVLCRVPRLEGVRAIIRGQRPVDRAPEPAVEPLLDPAAVLQAVREWDAVDRRGGDPERAVQALRYGGQHHERILSALAAAIAPAPTGSGVRVPLEDLQVGVVLAEDLLTTDGLLLVSRGQAVSAQRLARIHNFAATVGLAADPVALP